MAKRIEKDGKFYRMRRGKLVEIPPEWVGKHTNPQCIRNRRSKMTGKEKRYDMKDGHRCWKTPRSRQVENQQEMETYE